MSYQFATDVERLLREQMSAGNYESTDDLLRDALGVLKSRNDDLASIRAGLDDMQAGRTRPLMDVADEIGHKHGLIPE